MIQVDVIFLNVEKKPMEGQRVDTKRKMREGNKNEKKIFQYPVQNTKQKEKQVL